MSVEANSRLGGRATSQLALQSGTVTPSGGFTAHPEQFEAEFTDKPHPQRANPSG